mmetsp:Transcript_144581/g.360384  ORF Transcript_144581/g.360384 Transcript_144581/m.360384 type:complete len:244 (-) Transcript_144581:386-1117(-)
MPPTKMDLIATSSPSTCRAAFFTTPNEPRPNSAIILYSSWIALQPCLTECSPRRVCAPRMVGQLGASDRKVGVLMSNWSEYVLLFARNDGLATLLERHGLAPKDIAKAVGIRYTSLGSPYPIERMTSASLGEHTLRASSLESATVILGSRIAGSMEALDGVAAETDISERQSSASLAAALVQASPKRTRRSGLVAWGSAPACAPNRGDNNFGQLVEADGIGVLNSATSACSCSSSSSSPVLGN